MKESLIRMIRQLRSLLVETSKDADTKCLRNTLERVGTPVNVAGPPLDTCRPHTTPYLSISFSFFLNFFFKFFAHNK